MIRVNGSNFDLIWENSDGGGSIGSSGANRPFNIFLKSFQEYGEILTPSNPPANNHRLYFKADGNLYMLDSTGAESQVNGGGGGGGANQSLSNLTSPTAVNQDLVITAGHFINDNGNRHIIDVNSKNLMENGGNVTVSWAAYQLNDGSGQSVDWSARNLFDTIGNVTVDWQNQFLSDDAGNSAVDWKNKNMQDNGGNLVFDWKDKKLFDSASGAKSIDWEARTLYDSGGSGGTVFIWDTRIFYDITASPVAHFDNPGVFNVASLGVSNSVAATTLGSVTKSIEVFDNDGVSLGFIPVYDSIT